MFLIKKVIVSIWPVLGNPPIEQPAPDAQVIGGREMSNELRRPSRRPNTPVGGVKPNAIIPRRPYSGIFVRDDKGRPIPLEHLCSLGDEDEEEERDCEAECAEWCVAEGDEESEKNN